MNRFLGPPAWAQVPADDGSAVHLPCQHLDRRWWFSERPAELELAKTHCRRCPMQSPCLIGALARREPCGVWGGQIFDNGVTIAQKRPRGRPRRRYPRK
ncbi:MAG: WhiB family transcriptional regulator [Acidimicrobiaceae bacterium]|nr:WhiB family transcriptional regulator [Acidimicrobiaceae bacterium]